MFIAPMLPEPAEQPFSDDTYVFEPLYDGHRLLLVHQGVETRLWSGHKTECTRQYPELHRLRIQRDLILDGEICSIDPGTGRSCRELVIERSKLHSKEKIRAYAHHRPVIYMVWDILSLDGRDLRALPLVKRRSVLEAVVEPNEAVKLVPQTDGRGDALWRAVVKDSMEGMVAKRKNSPYVSRRSGDWLKIVNVGYRDGRTIGDTTTALLAASN